MQSVVPLQSVLLRNHEMSINVEKQISFQKYKNYTNMHMHGQWTYRYICTCDGIVCSSFADQLSASAKQLERYINSEPSPVVGTTYCDLRHFVEGVDTSRYFECSIAESPVITNDNCGHLEASLPDVNMCNDGKVQSVVVCCFIVHTGCTTLSSLSTDLTFFLIIFTWRRLYNMGCLM